MNARFAGSARHLAQETVCPIGRIGQTDTRREIIFRGGRNPSRDCLAVRQVIARHEISERCTWKGLRFHTGDERRGLMMHLRPGSYVVPAHAIIQSQIGLDTPTVLGENATVGSTLVKGGRRLLRIKIGQSQQKVGESVSSGLSSG